MPDSAVASSVLGVITVASGARRLRTAAIASSLSSLAPPFATITGSTTRAARGALASIVPATASITRLSCSMPVLIASAPISARQSSICWRMKAGSTATTPCTPVVSCAVSAVIAVMA